MLSIKDICQEANISQQTFYRLVRENPDFRTLVESGREKKGNGYKYDRAVLEWLYTYYDKEPDAGEEETPSSPSILPSDASELQEQIKSLTEERDALKRNLDALQAKYEKTEQERLAFFTQNAQLILLLGQEKQEKQALLPPPKKPFVERIKGIFKKEPQPEN